MSSCICSKTPRQACAKIVCAGSKSIWYFETSPLLVARRDEVKNSLTEKCENWMKRELPALTPKWLSPPMTITIRLEHANRRACSLRKLRNTKRPGHHNQALQYSLCKGPIRLLNFLQNSLICLIQGLW